MNENPLIDWMYSVDPYFKENGITKDQLKGNLFSDKDAYDDAMQQYYKEVYAPEHQSLSFDVFSNAYHKKWGDPFKKKDGGKELSPPSPTFEQGTLPDFADPIKAANQIEGAKALSKVRSERQGDFNSTGDQLKPLDEYAAHRNSRRTPLERLFSTDGQATLAEYNHTITTINEDMLDLKRAVDAIDFQINEKYGSLDEQKKKEERALELKNKIEQAKDRSGLHKEIEEFNLIRTELEDFYSDPLLKEREGYTQAYQNNLDKAKNILSQDNYQTVKKMLDMQESAQAYAEEKGKEYKYRPMKNLGRKLLLGPLEGVFAIRSLVNPQDAEDELGRGIILKSVAKVPAMLGTVMDFAETKIAGDKKYTGWDFVEDYLKDLQSDVETLNPAPTKFARPIVTTTADWKGNEVDFNSDGSIQAIRNKKGEKVDLDLTDAQLEEIQSLEKGRQFNPTGIAYQTGQVATDVLVQIGLTRGVAAPLQGLGMGTQWANRIGVTLSTMGVMANPLYEEGLEMFGDKGKAINYSLTVGSLVGIASNFLGIEAQMTGGKDNVVSKLLSSSKAFRSKAATGTLTVGDLARNRAKELIMAGGFSETLEEAVVEPLIQKSVEYMMGEKPEIDTNELLSTAVVSFATGALFKAGSSDINEIQKSSLYWASKNPQEFEKVLRQQINNKTIDLSFAELNTDEAKEDFVQRQRMRMDKLNQQMNALDAKKGVEPADLAYLLDQKNQAETRAEKAKAAGLPGIEKEELAVAKGLESEITKMLGYEPVDSDKKGETEGTPEKQTEVKKSEAEPQIKEEEQQLANEVQKVEEATTPEGRQEEEGGEQKTDEGQISRKPANAVTAIRAAFDEIAPTQKSMSDRELDSFLESRIEGFAKAFEDEGFVARGRIENGEPVLEVENIDTGEKNQLSGKTLSDTFRKVMGIEQGEDVETMTGKRLANKIIPETVEDEIAVFFAEGGRIKPEDYRQWGDKNTMDERVKLQFTSSKGSNIDVVAQEIAERTGRDEKEVTEAIIEFINSGKTPKDALREKLRQSVPELEVLTDEEFDQIDDTEIDEIDAETKKIVEGMSPEDQSDLINLIDDYTVDGVTDWDRMAEELDNEFVKELFSEDVRNKIKELATSESPVVAEEVDTQVESEAEVEEERTEGAKPVEHELNEEQKGKMNSGEPEIIEANFLGFKIQNILPKKLSDNLRKYIKLTFTSKGLLNQEVFDLNQKRVGYIARMVREAEYNVRNLKQVVKKEYGDEFVSEAFMNDLGDTLRNPRLNTNRRIVLPRTGHDLKPETRAALQAMRAHIKALSTEMVATGLITGDLAVTFTENLDTYLHRSYRVHVDPDWLEKVQLKPVWGRGIQWMKTQINQEIASHVQSSEFAKEKMDTALDRILTSDGKTKDKARKAYKFWKKKFEEEEAHIAKKTATYNNPVLVEAKLKALVEEQRESFYHSGVAKKGKLGSKDLGILKQRQDLDKPLRDIYGELNDPYMAYAQSIFKMAHLSANSNFLRQVRDAGMGKFLFEEIEDDPTGESTVKIAADQSSTMAPLNGLYTSPELAEAFGSFNEPLIQMPQIFWWASRIAGYAKYQKTINSPVTHVRNFVSSYIINVMNGRLGFSREQWREARDLTREDIDLFSKGDRGAQDRFLRLIELGVVDEDASWRELKGIFEDTEKGMDSMYDPRRSTVKKWLMKPLGGKTREQLYRNEDNFHKIMAFNTEKARYAKHLYGKKVSELTDEELADIETRAAKIVRDTTQTYSLVSRVVQGLRALPQVGTFVSFPYESVRILKNTILQIEEDYKDKRTRPIAYQRLAGLASVSVGAYALQALSMALAGLDDDDPIRWSLPEWSQHSVIFMTRKNGPEFEYVDTQTVLPIGFTISILNTLLDKRYSTSEKIGNAGWTALRPFLETDMTYGVMQDVVRGESSSGRTIAAQDDETVNKLWLNMLEIGKPFEPGWASTGRRIVKSFTDPELKYYGRLYPTTELLTAGTGIRFSQGNVEDAFWFRSAELADRIRDNKSIYESEARKQKYKIFPEDEARKTGHKNLTDQEREKALKSYKERAIKAYKRGMEDVLKIYQDNVLVGASAEELQSHMKRRGFAAHEVEAISKGEIPEPRFFDSPRVKTKPSKPTKKKKKTNPYEK